jgi:TusA-related sulfurtransferase
MKTKETQFKMPDGEVYEIIAANPSVAEAFVNRVRSGRAKE